MFSNTTATQTLVERWNGSTWTRVNSPNGGSTNSRLNGVHCVTTAVCFAVGTAAGRTLIEGWNGTAWSLSTIPVIPGATSSALSGVTCTGTTSCFAVGDYNFNGRRTLIERYS